MHYCNSYRVYQVKINRVNERDYPVTYYACLIKGIPNIIIELTNIPQYDSYITRRKK